MRKQRDTNLMTTPRKGVSLIEALMAIFITAIGLLSLLVLFPVGAFRMAQAITDDRSAHAASDAFAVAEARGLHSDPQLTFQNSTSLQMISYDVFTMHSVSNPLIPNANPAFPLPDLTQVQGYDGPSYPVYVDPIGILSDPRQFSITNNNIVNFGMLPFGNPVGTGIPRAAPSFVTTPALARYWFSLPDDLTFSNDGVYAGLATDPNQNPALAPGRDGTYTYGIMLRRPQFQNSSIVETTVAVYKNRPGVTGGENAYQNVKFLNPTLSATEVQIIWTPGAQEDPPIRKGSWIMDATVLGPTPPTRTAPYTFPEPHGYFYRVVNVTDQGAGTMTIELENPPKQSTVDASGFGYGVLVVMENVVEVFEKGPGWKP